VLRTSIKTTVAVLAAGTVLAACGPLKMGAAAILGDQRVTAANLDTEVASLNTAYQANARSVQLLFPAAQMPQQVLAWIVRFKVRDQLARQQGITVSPGDVQRALAQITSSAAQGGLGNVSLAQLAIANGLPPDLLNALGRYQAIQTTLITKLDGGRLPTSNAALQALGQQFDRDQCLASKSLDIRVNPQFGAVDYNQLAVVPAADTLSRPAPGESPAVSASPTAAPQLKPPC
jgi:hypothetical protein